MTTQKHFSKRWHFLYVPGHSLTEGTAARTAILCRKRASGTHVAGAVLQSHSRGRGLHTTGHHGWQCKDDPTNCAKTEMPRSLSRATSMAGSCWWGTGPHTGHRPERPRNGRTPGGTGTSVASVRTGGSQQKMHMFPGHSALLCGLSRPSQ